MSEFNCCENNFDREAGIQCDVCKFWVHMLCSNLPLYQIWAYKATTRKYECESCLEKRENFFTQLEGFKLAIREQEDALMSSVHTATIPDSDPSEKTDENDDEFHETSEGTDVQIIASHDSQTPTIIQENPNKSQTSQIQEKTHESQKANPDARNIQKSQMICPDYKHSWCYDIKHCPYRHPKICPEFMEDGYGQYGCKRIGRRCPRGAFHPDICKDSWHNRVCPNRSCEYRHLKYTRRFIRDKTQSHKFDSPPPLMRPNFQDVRQPPLPPGQQTIHMTEGQTALSQPPIQSQPITAQENTATFSLEELRTLLRQMIREETGKGPNAEQPVQTQQPVYHTQNAQANFAPPPRYQTVPVQTPFAPQEVFQTRGPFFQNLPVVGC